MRCPSRAALALLVVAAHSLAAQTLTVGLKAGATAAHFVSDDENYYSARKAPAAAANVTLRLWQVLGLRVEGMLLERGSVGGIDMRIRYAEVGVLARLAVPREFLGVKAAALFGVARARETGCHLVVWDVGGIPEDPTPAAPHERPCEWWRQTGLDRGLVAGLEIEKRLRRGRVTIELRHTRGTTDLASMYPCCWLENRTWALLIGYDVALIR